MLDREKVWTSISAITMSYLRRGHTLILLLAGLVSAIDGLCWSFLPYAFQGLLTLAAWSITSAVAWCLSRIIDTAVGHFSICSSPEKDSGKLSLEYEKYVNISTALSWAFITIGAVPGTLFVLSSEGFYRSACILVLMFVSAVFPILGYKYAVKLAEISAKAAKFGMDRDEVIARSRMTLVLDTIDSFVGIIPIVSILLLCIDSVILSDDITAFMLARSSAVSIMANGLFASSRQIRQYIAARSAIRKFNS